MSSRGDSSNGPEDGARYLRVKRKIAEDPCFSSRQYKRCKFIASVKSNLLTDILKVINNQDVSENQIIDFNQNLITCNGVPLEAGEPSNDYVYDIYSLQDLDNNLYSVNEEEEVTDDSDSNDENNSRNDYPDEDYEYRDHFNSRGDAANYWDDEDAEGYRLRDSFDDFGLRDTGDLDGSSSSDSMNNYGEEEVEENENSDPDDVDKPSAPPISRSSRRIP
ncbi:uncharacterized protein LOC141852546 isoform X2 [Brevipalpus obovatus]|uniref:uncharacterized protein LOC141852546 isoform X2 n=1 Tax=Brevipalpus obovatus TaxID=246614 RepID=UPI003D9DCF74